MGRTNTCEFRHICFYERQIPQSHGILYVNLRNDNFHRLPQLRADLAEVVDRQLSLRRVIRLGKSRNCGGLGISRNCGGLAEIVDRQLSLRRVIATPCGTVFTQRNCAPMHRADTCAASVQPFIWRQSRLHISEHRSIL